MFKKWKKWWGSKYLHLFVFVCTFIENRWYGHHFLRVWVWEAKEGCLALFGAIYSCDKISKNAECRKIMRPRTYRNCKAKQSQTWDIFKIPFHMFCVRNLKSLQKIFKNVENLCDHGHATIMITKWAKLWNKLLSVFWWPPAKPQPNIIESGVSGHDQCSWVTFRKLGPLLVEVMNGCQ